MESTAALRTHPLILAAAGAALVFSVVGTAAVMGWLPASQGSATQGRAPAATPAPLAAVTEAPQPVMQPVPRPAAPKPAATRPAQPKPMISTGTPAPMQGGGTASAPVYAPEPVRTVHSEPTREPARAFCNDCGSVMAVNEIAVPANRDPGLGAVLGGVAGGAAGSQIGGGKGRYVGAVLGAVGGAVAGHQIEKRVRTDTAYEVVIRLDDGTTRTVTQSERPAWRTGDRVRVNGNDIEQAT